MLKGLGFDNDMQIYFSGSNPTFAFFPSPRESELSAVDNGGRALPDRTGRIWPRIVPVDAAACRACRDPGGRNQS